MSEDNNSPKSSQSGLITAIIFAALAVSGSLVFLGTQMSGTGAGAGAGIQANVVADAPKSGPTDNTITADMEKLIDDDAILGDKNAPVTLVEFSDYECPFCKRHFTQTAPQIKEKYIDTGKVRFVFRDFPLGFHDPLATQEAMASECAHELGGDNAFWKYHDLVFQTTTSNGQGLQKDQLYSLAEKAGVNKAKFTECLDSEKYKDEVAKDSASGSGFGVSGTPGFVLSNGETSKLIKGAVPFATFQATIDALLN